MKKFKRLNCRCKPYQSEFSDRFLKIWESLYYATDTLTSWEFQKNSINLKAAQLILQDWERSFTENCHGQPDRKNVFKMLSELSYLLGEYRDCLDAQIEGIEFHLKRACTLTRPIALHLKKTVSKILDKNGAGAVCVVASDPCTVNVRKLVRCRCGRLRSRVDRGAVRCDQT